MASQDAEQDLDRQQPGIALRDPPQELALHAIDRGSGRKRYGDLPKRASELDSSREIVAHCRSGKRSADAVQFLQQAGFRKIWNLKGGILAWSDEVDPSVPKY